MFRWTLVAYHLLNCDIVIIKYPRRQSSSVQQLNHACDSLSWLHPIVVRGMLPRGSPTEASADCHPLSPEQKGRSFC